jgi:hypothetical protein
MLTTTSPSVELRWTGCFVSDDAEADGDPPPGEEADPDVDAPGKVVERWFGGAGANPTAFLRLAAAPPPTAAGELGTGPPTPS